MDSIYDGLKHRKDNRKHLGFDYRGQILKRTLSNQMIGVSPILDGFIIRADGVMYGLVEAAKNVKKWFNYTIEKNETRFN